MKLFKKIINIYILSCNKIIIQYEWIIKRIMMRMIMWEKS